jgi:hypothetical protein
MRYKRWNLGLLTVQGALVVWAHVVGVSWLALGLLFAGLAVVASAGLSYFFRVQMPRAHRRHERQLQAALAEHALLVRAPTVEHVARPTPPTAPAPEPSASEREAA